MALETDTTTRSSGGMADTAKATTQTARDEAGNVAGAAKEGLQEVGHEARRQARGLLHDARGELDRQTGELVDRMAEGLQRTGEQARALISGRPEEAGKLGEYVSEAADRIQGFADDVRRKGASGILEDTKAFARRRPGAFLLGALAAGFAAGRLVRATRESGESSEPSADMIAQEPFGTMPAGTTGDVDLTYTPEPYPTQGMPVTTPDYPATTPEYPGTVQTPTQPPQPNQGW